MEGFLCREDGSFLQHGSPELVRTGLDSQISITCAFREKRRSGERDWQHLG